jgi:hypothetical protein
MDKASQVLAQGVPPGVPKSFRTLADHGDVPRTTLQHRARGRRSKEEKARSQHYLYPWEAKALVRFLVQQDALGRPVRIKYIPSIAFSLARRQRPPLRTGQASLRTRTGLSSSTNAIQSSERAKTERWTGTVTTYMIRSCTGSR